MLTNVVGPIFGTLWFEEKIKKYSNQDYRNACAVTRDKLEKKVDFISKLIISTISCVEKEMPPEVEKRLVELISIGVKLDIFSPSNLLKHRRLRTLLDRPVSVENVSITEALRGAGAPVYDKLIDEMGSGQMQGLVHSIFERETAGRPKNILQILDKYMGLAAETGDFPLLVKISKIDQRGEFPGRAFMQALSNDNQSLGMQILQKWNVDPLTTHMSPDEAECSLLETCFEKKWVGVCQYFFDTSSEVQKFEALFPALFRSIFSLPADDDIENYAPYQKNALALFELLVENHATVSSEQLRQSVTLQSLELFQFVWEKCQVKPSGAVLNTILEDAGAPDEDRIACFVLKQMQTEQFASKFTFLLQRAIEFNQEKVIEELLSRLKKGSFDPSWINPKEDPTVSTPLELSIVKGNWDTARKLIELGARLVRAQTGWTVLHQAAQSYSQFNPVFFDEILERLPESERKDFLVRSCERVGKQPVTAVDLALEKKNSAVIAYLLQKEKLYGPLFTKRNMHALALVPDLGHACAESALTKLNKGEVSEMTLPLLLFADSTFESPEGELLMAKLYADSRIAWDVVPKHPRPSSRSNTERGAIFLDQLRKHKLFKDEIMRLNPGKPTIFHNATDPVNADFVIAQCQRAREILTPEEIRKLFSHEDSTSSTPFQIALQKGNEPVIRYFLDQGIAYVSSDYLSKHPDSLGGLTSQLKDDDLKKKVLFQIYQNVKNKPTVLETIDFSVFFMGNLVPTNRTLVFKDRQKNEIIRFGVHEDLCLKKSEFFRAKTSHGMKDVDDEEIVVEDIAAADSLMIETYILGMYRKAHLVITQDNFRGLAELNHFLDVPLWDEHLRTWLKEHPECERWEKKYLPPQSVEKSAKKMKI